MIKDKSDTLHGLGKLLNECGIQWRVFQEYLDGEKSKLISLFEDITVMICTGYDEDFNEGLIRVDLYKLKEHYNITDDKIWSTLKSKINTRFQVIDIVSLFKIVPEIGKHGVDIEQYIIQKLISR